MNRRERKELVDAILDHPDVRVALEKSPPNRCQAWEDERRQIVNHFEAGLDDFLHGQLESAKDEAENAARLITKARNHDREAA
jgi:hypothetical protein